MKLLSLQSNTWRRAAALLLGAVALQSVAHAEHSYQAWSTSFNEAQQAGQTPNATVVDKRGNVYVTGNAGVQGSDTVCYTAKYDALDGHVIWFATYDSGFGDNISNAIAIDGNGDIIIAGAAPNSNHDLDYLTIKYSGKDGAVLWTQTYGRVQDGADEALKVVTDAFNEVIVTGRSLGSGTQYDFLTIKYGSAGNFQWLRTYNGAANKDDIPTGLAVDSDGNIIVTGSTYLTTAQTSYITIKYKPDGSAFWSSAKTFTSASDAQPTAITVDPFKNIIVTGYGRNADDTRYFYTVAYSSSTAGGVLWSQIHSSIDSDYVGGAADVTTDPAGNVFVTGTTVGAAPFDNNAYYTAKYLAANSIFAGFKVWEATSSSRDGVDHARRIIADGAGNVVVTGYSDDPVNHAADYYTVKYDGNTGDVLWEQLYDGDGSDDIPTALAVDSAGNVTVTGTSELPFNGGGILYSRFVTIKYNRLALTTGEAAPIATNVPAGTTVTYIGSPSIADTGDLAARVLIKTGAKSRWGILTQGSAGGSMLAAVQGNPAAGASPGTYSSFQDPIVSSIGLLAFSARIAGVPAAKSAGVWISDSAGNLSLILQSGTPVPGLGGPILRSVTSIAMRGTVLVALINVTGTNPTELYAYDSFFGGRHLVRVGDSIAPGGKVSTITKISALLPAPGSPGQGRTQGNSQCIAKATLKDGRIALLQVSSLGALTTLEATGNTFDGGTATWLGFGSPALDSSGSYFTTLGVFKPGAAATATGLFAGSNPFDATLFAEKGGSVLSGGGAKYLSFFDPLINNLGNVAFMANLYGTGVTAKNHAAIFSGAPAFPLPVARLGFQSTGTDGALVPAVYTGFVSLALPGGAGAGPIFTAHVAGAGLNVRNNYGVWGVDDNGLTRRLLKTGDTFTIDQIVHGTHVIKTVSSMTLLQPLAGVYGATRSFNETGSVAVLLGFTDHTQSILRIGIP